MLPTSRAHDRLTGFLARAESAGMLDEIEKKAESDRDKKRAELAAQLAAVEPTHERAISQASKALEEADNRCIDARVRHVTADAKLREAWSLYHAAHAVRDNARGAIEQRLKALAPEIVQETDFTLMRLENYLFNSLYFDRVMGEPDSFTGAIPMKRFTNKPVIQLLLAEVRQARAKVVGMAYSAATFATIKDTCRATLAEIRTRIVSARLNPLAGGDQTKDTVPALPNAASEVGLILFGSTFGKEPGASR
jgi:hypothetical protein